ncbi:MAG TPA: DUF5908 family protein [Burkholderiaceae bacterium]
MPIEIKQMVVKSNVVQACGGEAEADGKAMPEAEKKALLDECRRMIQEALREAKER